MTTSAWICCISKLLYNCLPTPQSGLIMQQLNSRRLKRKCDSGSFLDYCGCTLERLMDQTMSTNWCENTTELKEMCFSGMNRGDYSSIQNDFEIPFTPQSIFGIRRRKKLQILLVFLTYKTVFCTVA